MQRATWISLFISKQWVSEWTDTKLPPTYCVTCTAEPRSANFNRLICELVCFSNLLLHSPTRRGNKPSHCKRSWLTDKQLCGQIIAELWNVFQFPLVRTFYFQESPGTLTGLSVGKLPMIQINRNFCEIMLPNKKPLENVKTLVELNRRITWSKIILPLSNL